ncbi:hypothetical protein HY496_02700 [Candidatus Woesearchaeota archaeon]|nr:hypothetical protein [Candidatus Woesearchaeota archaeon]
MSLRDHLHYYPDLRTWFPTTNTDENTVVLNREFKEFTRLISYKLNENNPEGIHWRRYTSEEDQKLLKLCCEHAEDYRKNSRGRNVIMFTHPFFLPLTHYHLISSERQKEDLDGYLNDLSHLLHLERDPANVEVVALETLHGYAAATSLLLETGIVDRVILTEFASGYPLEKNGLQELADRSVFVGGSYDERCFHHSTKELHYFKKKLGNEKRVVGMRRMVLRAPWEPYKNGSIRCLRIRGISQKDILPLSAVIGQLGLT